MPMYFFHLRDRDNIADLDGTDLIDVAAARDHANTVARELMFRSSSLLDEEWSKWSMHVLDADGLELFSMAMSDVKNGNGP